MRPQMFNRTHHRRQCTARQQLHWQYSRGDTQLLGDSRAPISGARRRIRCSTEPFPTRRADLVLVHRTAPQYHVDRPFIRTHARASFESNMPKAKGGTKSSTSKGPSGAGQATTAASAPPAWPVFKPPLPITDLAPETLLDRRVALIRNFWPKSLCRDYVSFLRGLPLTTTPGKPKRGMAARVNDRFQVQDQRFADRLWMETGLREVLLGDEYRALW